jgi:hypothetical protein
VDRGMSIEVVLAKFWQQTLKPHYQSVVTI